MSKVLQVKARHFKVPNAFEILILIIMQKASQQTYVFVWGMGQNKSLGNGKNKSEAVPYLIKELKNVVCSHISSGNYFTVVCTEKGQIYGWGVGKNCRFGINEELVEQPRKVPFNKIVTQISAGNWHTLAIDSLGDVYGVGHNKYGALGLGHFNEAQEFTKCKLPSPCKRISCGDGFSLFLTQEGDLLTSGHNSFHGHKTKDNIHTPTKLKVEVKWDYIAAGFTHSACVTSNGQVYTWGEGNFYQLGHNSKNNEKEPRRVEALKEVAIVNTSCTRGEKNAHTMAVSKQGIVYTWGAGYKGKLGHEKSWSHSNQADEPIPRPMEALREVRFAKAIAGGIHSGILSEDGKIYTFGCGSDGRLGHQESQEYVYLYRQGFPKEIETLKGYLVVEMTSSYYHNACIATQRK